MSRQQTVAEAANKQAESAADKQLEYRLEEIALGKSKRRESCIKPRETASEQEPSIEKEVSQNKAANTTTYRSEAPANTKRGFKRSPY